MNTVDMMYDLRQICARDTMPMLCFFFAHLYCVTFSLIANVHKLILLCFHHFILLNSIWLAKMTSLTPLHRHPPPPALHASNLSISPLWSFPCISTEATDVHSLQLSFSFLFFCSHLSLSKTVGPFPPNDPYYSGACSECHLSGELAIHHHPRLLPVTQSESCPRPGHSLSSSHWYRAEHGCPSILDKPEK